MISVYKHLYHEYSNKMIVFPSFLPFPFVFVLKWDVRSSSYPNKEKGTGFLFSRKEPILYHADSSIRNLLVVMTTILQNDMCVPIDVCNFRLRHLSSWRNEGHICDTPYLYAIVIGHHVITVQYTILCDRSFAFDIMLVLLCTAQYVRRA